MTTVSLVCWSGGVCSVVVTALGVNGVPNDYKTRLGKGRGEGWRGWRSGGEEEEKEGVVSLCC